MAFGNLKFGGLIGAGVDIGTGAAYDYPQVISIPLVCGPNDASSADKVAQTGKVDEPAAVASTASAADVKK